MGVTKMQYPIIDSHCHIYPDKIAEKAVEGIGSFYDLPMCYDGKASTLIEKGNKIGVCHNIIFSVATTPHQVGSINSFISNCVKEGEGRFTGLGALHPDTENVASEIENIKALGLKGVKLHPDFQKFRINDERLFSIYKACSEAELPVLLHTGDYRYDFSNPERMADVLEKFPELTVIGAHFGGWYQYIICGHAPSADWKPYTIKIAGTQVGNPGTKWTVGTAGIKFIIFNNGKNNGKEGMFFRNLTITTPDK
jgi:predicted TIM-barrel fold metal-dependent hydrolase